VYKLFEKKKWQEKVLKDVASKFTFGTITFYLIIYVVAPIMVLIKQVDLLHENKLLGVIITALIAFPIIRLITNLKKVKENIEYFKNIEDWKNSDYYKKGKFYYRFHFVFLFVSFILVGVTMKLIHSMFT
jgi:hypothetical protein